MFSGVGMQHILEAATILLEKPVDMRLKPLDLSLKGY